MTEIERLIIEQTTPHKASFWGEDIEDFAAVLANRVFGDGQRLIYVTPLATRPYYYIIRIDSQEPTEEQESEYVDTVLLEQIAEEFGEHRDDDGEGDEDEFPTLDISCGWAWDFA